MLSLFRYQRKKLTDRLQLFLRDPAERGNLREVGFTEPRLSITDMAAAQHFQAGISVGVLKQRNIRGDSDDEAQEIPARMPVGEHWFRPGLRGGSDGSGGRAGGACNQRR